MNRDLIVDRIDAYEVTVPIEAPLRHSYGIHEAFTRTVVEVHTAGGLIGLGETATPAAQVLSQSSVALGLNVFELGTLRMRVSQRFYWSRNPLIAAAFEMAFIDVQGHATGLPAHTLLGGALRPAIDMAAYCFYRYPSDAFDAVSTPAEMADHAESLVRRFGYRTVKLKGGVLDPAVEVATARALRERLPDVALRFDPNAAWTPTTAVSWSRDFEEIGLEYYEDPAPGQAGMAEVRSRTRLPLATNMVVVDFEDIPGALAQRSVDVILSDPWYWGGPTRTQVLAEMCHVLGLGVGMHSGIELGIGMAVMAHTGITIPNLTMAVDAHYHHLTDDIIAGDRLLPAGDGTVRPPDGPGWGVRLDPDKTAEYRGLHAAGKYANLYAEGTSGHGADRFRPDWHPVMPSW